MNETIRIAFLSALLLTLSQSAAAQTYDWYSAAGAGLSFLSDTDSSQGGFTITSEFATSGAGYGAVGRVFDSFRAEAEVFVSVNEFDKLQGGGLSVGASGNVQTIAFMANGYYDFSTGSKWRPYIGGGIGVASVAVNDLEAQGILIADDDDTVFAYQLKAGVAYQFTERWEGTLGYRYFGSDDGDFVDSSGAAFTSDGLELHVVEIGARYRW
ncbi:MAG: outer membrane beta-barrel protein [Gammaproteobacteria bacterium]|nr:outer membrane beta-barrel protein [Gammaproteobacteria bacterium]